MESSSPWPVKHSKASNKFSSRVFCKGLHFKRRFWLYYKSLQFIWNTLHTIQFVVFPSSFHCASRKCSMQFLFCVKWDRPNATINDMNNVKNFTKTLEGNYKKSSFIIFSLILFSLTIFRQECKYVEFETRCRSESC